MDIISSAAQETIEQSNALLEHTVVPQIETGPPLEHKENINMGEPEDYAAAFFKKQKPVLKSLLNEMSAKQIRRFVMHVAAFPLHNEGEVPKGKEEIFAARIFNEMVHNRMIMQLAAEWKKVEETTKMQTNNETEVTGG